MRIVYKGNYIRMTCGEIGLVDPDEMQLYAAFHLGLHYLQKYSFGGFPNTKGKCHLTVFDIISMHAIISTHYFSWTNITISMLLPSLSFDSFRIWKQRFKPLKIKTNKSVSCIMTVTSLTIYTAPVT